MNGRAMAGKFDDRKLNRKGDPEEPLDRRRPL